MGPQMTCQKPGASLATEPTERAEKKRFSEFKPKKSALCAL